MDTNRAGVCQRSIRCRKEYHVRSDKPKLTETELQTILLSKIFALVPGLRTEVAREIAFAMTAKARKEALTRFAKCVGCVPR